MHELIDKNYRGPYLLTSLSDRRITIITLLAMSVPAVAYSFLVDGTFFLKYLLVIAAGAVIEELYSLFDRGRFIIPSPGTAVTSGLLALSLPASISMLPLLCGVLISLLFVKLPSKSFSGISFNPMLVGRVFISLLWGEAVINWGESLQPDMLTGATPLGIFKEAEVTVPLSYYLTGHYNGTIDGMFQAMPASPGEALPVLTLVLGIFLIVFKIIDWRLPLAFLVTTALFFLIGGTPVVFGLLSGALIFSAVFIATCPTATPAEPAGRIIAGVIAGAVNCAIRKFTYYPEGIMYTFLLISLISPTIDRTVFFLKTKFGK